MSNSGEIRDAGGRKLSRTDLAEWDRMNRENATAAAKKRHEGARNEGGRR